MAERVPMITRRNFLMGTALAAGASLVAGCGPDAANDSSSRPTTPTPSPKASASTRQKRPVEAYVENWHQPADYVKMQRVLTPGSLSRLYIAFGIPNARDGVLLDQMKPEMAAFIDHQKTEVSLSVGGYGDDTVEPTLAYSRTSVLSGFAAGLQNPEAFAGAVTRARQQVGAELGRPWKEIGVDIDFEYPTQAQTVALNGLMQTVSTTLDAPLTMAIASRDNLPGYDVPTLLGTVDRLNVMTYANGADYGPRGVVADMRKLSDIAGGADKLAIGFATYADEDPLLWTPDAMNRINQGLAEADINPAASFVWSTTGLDMPRVNAMAA